MRVMVENEMDNIKSRKGFIFGNLVYILCYLILIIPAGIALGIMSINIYLNITFLVVLNFIFLRAAGRIKLKATNRKWLDKIDFTKIREKKKIEKDFDIQIDRVDEIRIIKNEKGNHIFFALNDEFNQLDGPLEKFVFSKERRVLLRGSKLIEKAKEQDLDLLYSLSSFKANVDKINQDTLVFCRKVNKEELKKIKAGL